MFKKKIDFQDLILILMNLIPVWGVWFDGWIAREVFLIYCLETILIGLFNILKMSITSFYRKKDVWNSVGGQVTMASSWLFICFFAVHYGFFVAIQLFIFWGTSGAETALGISALQFILNFPKYLSSGSTYWLGTMVLSYVLIMVKEFLFSGKYKTVPMTALMFEPYERIIIQQFTVIVGSLFLGLGAGKIFVSIFAAIKIWVEVFFDFPRILRITTEKAKLRQLREK